MSAKQIAMERVEAQGKRSKKILTAHMEIAEWADLARAVAAESDAKDAEMKELRQTIAEQTHHSLRAKLTAANAALQNALSALKRYGIHDPICPHDPCRCGFAAALAALPAPEVKG